MDEQVRRGAGAFTDELSSWKGRCVRGCTGFRSLRRFASKFSCVRKRIGTGGFGEPGAFISGEVSRATCWAMRPRWFGRLSVHPTQLA